MFESEERAFEMKAAKMLRGQRELPVGRNFMCFRFHAEDEEDLQNYRDNFDKAFPRSPGCGI